MTSEMRGPVTARIVVEISIDALDDAVYSMRPDDEWVGRAFGELDRLVGQLRSQLLKGLDDRHGYVGKITDVAVCDARVDVGGSRYRRKARQ